MQQPGAEAPPLSSQPKSLVIPSPTSRPVANAKSSITEWISVASATPNCGSCGDWRVWRLSRASLPLFRSELAQWAVRPRRPSNSEDPIASYRPTVACLKRLNPPFQALYSSKFATPAQRFARVPPHRYRLPLRFSVDKEIARSSVLS